MIQNTPPAGALGLAADYGNTMLRDTKSGTMTASLDPVQVALAVRSIQISTDAMRAQFGQFLSIFNSLA